MPRPKNDFLPCMSWHWQKIHRRYSHSVIVKNAAEPADAAARFVVVRAKSKIRAAMPKSRGRKPKKPRAPTKRAPKQLIAHNTPPREPPISAQTVQQEPSIPPQTVQQE